MVGPLKPLVGAGFELLESCVCVSVCVCVCVCIHVYMCAYVFIRACLRMSAHTSMFHVAKATAWEAVPCIRLREKN